MLNKKEAEGARRRRGNRHEIESKSIVYKFFMVFKRLGLGNSVHR